jgi:divinyl protochlorophyllide a 8-vinyl-reductase
MLLAAIRRNAWTFSGSGHLDAEGGMPVRLRLSGCPLCRGATTVAPICDYYATTFERLFRTLVSPDAVVTETICHAMGAAACEYEVRW